MAKKAAKDTTQKAQTDATPDKPKSNLGNRPTVGEWDFSGEEVDEVPATVRTNTTQRLPFPWDRYAAAGKSVKVSVPLKFWTEGRGYSADDCTATACKERLRRAFYGWKEADKKGRATYVLSFSDQYDKASKAYTGTNMYFSSKALKAAA